MAALAHVELARAVAGAEYYDCATCAKRPDYYARLGHDGPPAPDALGNEPLWEHNLVTGEALRRCPRRDEIEAGRETPVLLAEVLRMRHDYHPLWTKGHVLTDGGASAQPARYVDAMQTLDLLAAQAETRYAQITKATGQAPTAPRAEE